MGKYLPVAFFILLVFLLVAGYFIAEGKKERSEFTFPNKIDPLSWVARPKNKEEKIYTFSQESKELKQKIASEQKELSQRVPIPEECLKVPIYDPKAGSSAIFRVDANTNDYFIEGRLAEITEEEIGNCPYKVLVLALAREFSLRIPAGLLAQTDQGKVAPDIYEDYLGKQVKLRVRYQTEATAPAHLKVLEWEPIVFYSN
jgi:hypothetical protein